MSHVKYEVYADGSATVANKPGGYGYVIVADGVKHSEGSGALEAATNNDAELEAAIQGLAATMKLILKNLNTSYSVTLVSDSQIVLGWADGSYRFKQQNKLAKYEALCFLVKRLNVKTRWVEGHSGDEHNERCDTLANEARRSIIPVDPDSKKERKKKNKELKREALKNPIKIDEGVMLLNYRGIVKRIDLTKNTIEDYNIELE